jgi:hypothetical protein
MRWNIVIPFSKPEMVHRCVNGLLRQRGVDEAVVCFVLSADCWELCSLLSGLLKNSPFRAAFERAPYKGVSHARNAGNRFFQDGFSVVDSEHGQALLQHLDCDDYYGPGFLREQYEHMRPGRIVGKTMRFVYDAGGLMLIQHSKNEGNRIIKTPSVISGATHGMMLNESSLYPIKKYGEDGLYCHAFVQRGGEMYETSIFNYCYMRDAHSHTWNIDVREKARVSRTIKTIGLDFDEAIINGEKSI